MAKERYFTYYSTKVLKWTPQLIPESKISITPRLVHELIILSTALHLAVRRNVDYDIARILLENGADLESLNIRKQTPLHSFFSPLVSTLAQRHCSSLPVVSTDARGMNLAHYFSWSNSSVPSNFQHLPNETSFLNQLDTEGRKPHHLAAQRGNIVVLDYLLTRTTSPHDTLVDRSGNTLLHHAVLSIRAPDTIRLLLSRGFCLEAQNTQSHTPLQYAACWGTAEAVSFLLNLDPEDVIAQDAHGNDLLALARSGENRKVEKLLVTRYGELLQNNKTPLVMRDCDAGSRHRISRGKAHYVVSVLIALFSMILLKYGYLI